MFEVFYVGVPVVCFTVMIAILVRDALRARRTLQETDAELRARAPRASRAAAGGPPSSAAASPLTPFAPERRLPR